MTAGDGSFSLKCVITSDPPKKKSNGGGGDGPRPGAFERYRVQSRANRGETDSRHKWAIGEKIGTGAARNSRNTPLGKKILRREFGFSARLETLPGGFGGPA